MRKQMRGGTETRHRQTPTMPRGAVRASLEARMKRLLFPAWLGLCLASSVAVAELRVPAFTAYLDPSPEGARISEKNGIRGWKDPALKVLWFGDVRSAGMFTASVALRLPAGTVSKLRLTAAGQSRDASVTGAGEDKIVTAGFGGFEAKAAGPLRFELASLNAAGSPAGDLDALLLDGPAMVDAHFNLEERRNAASVHLAYPTPKELLIEGFYDEVTAVDDPTSTFYMACGWHRGYFGMQVNSATERRIIFSVWDSGNEAVDRAKVPKEDRVQLLAKGDGVVANDFGNEGTGGHSHRVFPWKTGETQRFYVTARPADATHTIYTGYFLAAGETRWQLIASFKAPKDGGRLRGLHSFSENFWGSNGHLRRKALYGDQWIRTSDGRWTELTVATFSHDPTGKKARLDRSMGIEDGRFYLSHGGFGPASTRFGERFERIPTGKAPVIDLPEVPGI